MEIIFNTSQLNLIKILQKKKVSIRTVYSLSIENVCKQWRKDLVSQVDSSNAQNRLLLKLVGIWHDPSWFGSILNSVRAIAAAKSEENCSYFVWFKLYVTLKTCMEKIKTIVLEARIRITKQVSPQRKFILTGTCRL